MTCEQFVILDPDIRSSNLLKYTTIAFELIPRIDKPTILDAGRGTGVPTVRLAELSNGMVVAADVDPKALARLAGKLGQKRLRSPSQAVALSDRIHTLR